mgnify:CR=1 FL=1
MTQLIARRLRDAGFYSEIVPSTSDCNEYIEKKPKGIILSGGPDSVTNTYTPRVPKIVFELNIPILGICYGMQTLAEQMGGQVISADQKEFGYAELKINNESVLFSDLQKSLNVWMSHGDKVVKLPKQFKRIASSTNSKIAAIASNDGQRFGVQFHPEVSHTDQGQKILSNFALDVCGCKKNWTSKNIIDDLVQSIKDQVGKKHVLLGLILKVFLGIFHTKLFLIKLQFLLSFLQSAVYIANQNQG